MNRFLNLMAAVLLLPLCVLPCRAQDASDAELGESAAAVRGIRALQNKTLIFVFDVSGSMTGQHMTRAREATINILREGAGAGDRVVLFTFGSDYTKVFDETLANEAAKSALIEQVPARPGGGAGTNIRKPHHEALKILETALPRPGAVVLLTDSFNDEPRRDDPAYATYLRYYTPGGRLQKHPDTPENRDYERLLAKMTRSRKINVYGIGVQIDESGRPVERLPQAAPEVQEAPSVAVVTSPATARPVGGEIPWLWIGLGTAALILGLLALMPLSRTSFLRVSGGPGGPKDFQIKNGQTVRLGSDGAAAAFDAYPLPGVREPAAVIRGARGQMVLAPAAPPGAPGGTGNQSPAPRVFHNGLPLEKEVPLAYGDEVRVSVPDPSGVGVAKEFRLKFDDPKKAF